MSCWCIYPNIRYWVLGICNFFKCVLCIVSIHLINKYAGEKFRYIGLIFYFTWFAYYLYIDAPFRNSIAAMLFLLSIPLLEKENFPIFCMAVLAFLSIQQQYSWFLYIGFIRGIYPWKMYFLICANFCYIFRSKCDFIIVFIFIFLASNNI